MNLTHTFLIKNDGSVWGIGNNQYGQLGTGETSSTVYNMTQMLLPSKLQVLYLELSYIQWF